MPKFLTAHVNLDYGEETIEVHDGVTGESLGRLPVTGYELRVKARAGGGGVLVLEIPVYKAAGKIETGNPGAGYA